MQCDANEVTKPLSSVAMLEAATEAHGFCGCRSRYGGYARVSAAAGDPDHNGRVLAYLRRDARRVRKAPRSVTSKYHDLPVPHRRERTNAQYGQAHALQWHH